MYCGFVNLILQVNVAFACKKLNWRNWWRMMEHSEESKATALFYSVVMEFNVPWWTLFIRTFHSIYEGTDFFSEAANLKWIRNQKLHPNKIIVINRCNWEIKLFRFKGYLVSSNINPDYYHQNVHIFPWGKREICAVGNMRFLLVISF